jgi:hypothetical protein
MSVELLEDKKLWDQFVENSPQGTLFHTWDFLKIVERDSGSQLLPYAIFSGTNLRCIFPFFITRRLGLTAMCSPPRDAQIPYLGFAFDPSVAGLLGTLSHLLVPRNSKNFLVAAGLWWFFMLRIRIPTTWTPGRSVTSHRRTAALRGRPQRR